MRIDSLSVDVSMIGAVLGLLALFIGGLITQLRARKERKNLNQRGVEALRNLDVKMAETARLKSLTERLLRVNALLKMSYWAVLRYGLERRKPTTQTYREDNLQKALEELTAVADQIAAWDVSDTLRFTEQGTMKLDPIDRENPNEETEEANGRRADSENRNPEA